MAIGAVHGLSGGFGIVKQEVVENSKGYKILYTEYANGFVTMDARGFDSVYAANATVTVTFDFPNGVKLDPNSYCVTVAFSTNGQLVRDMRVMADSGGNAKYDENGFNYSWYLTSKYQVGFIFHIAGFLKK